MTVNEAITETDAIKPNAFSRATKLRWLNSLEGQLALEVFLMAPTEVKKNFIYTADDLETELLVEPPYDDLYIQWLSAQIDAANGEYDRYQNAMTIFERRKREFICWFVQLYDPAQGRRFLPTAEEEESDNG